jgi:hypothetical protein
MENKIGKSRSQAPTLRKTDLVESLTSFPALLGRKSDAKTLGILKPQFKSPEQLCWAK